MLVGVVVALVAALGILLAWLLGGDMFRGDAEDAEDMPVDTGYRFRQIRVYPACVAMFLNPAAKTAPAFARHPA